MRQVLALGVAVAVLAGCDGLVFGPLQKPGGPVSPGITDPGRLRTLTTAQVFEELKGTCAGCHADGMNKPFFASVNAFQKLLVEDTAWVVPAKPAQSNLLALLEGRGTGQYTQMPSTGDTFSKLAADGHTTVNMAELSLWISSLETQVTTPTGPVVDTYLKRKTAEQILNALYKQLGLTESDFINSDLDAIADYATRSPDDYFQKYGEKPGAANWVALGGPNYVEGLARKTDVGATFAQALTPISQAFCRRSILKSGNNALFIDAKLSDTSATAKASIENNIRSLHLKMLGQPATDDDVAELLGLFQEVEPKGTTTAWTAVCSALIRDPLWVFY
ncbi:MAG: hypothetical protein K1X64_18455 [Myxococcaceae bacterium]|nr:hypothetical protein [Myxococcaceae bacterium]